MKNFKIYALLSLIHVFFIAGAVIQSPTHVNITGVASTYLTIYWIDTEGGAATLVVTPSGESILIDAGNPGGRDSERIYEVAHNIAGLKQIDHLVITHWHNDHFGGATLLAAKMPIIEVLDKGIVDSLLSDKSVADNLKAYQAMSVKHRSIVKPGAAMKLINLPKGFQKLSFRFVGLDKHFANVTNTATLTKDCAGLIEKAVDNTDNANSQVMVLDYGPFRFFDGGDLTWNIEKLLVCPRNLVGTVDVYQVNHHGLDQSNNPILIKSLSPTVTIMGNGTQKGCGPETITSLRNTPSIQAQYQLHKNIRQDSTYNTKDEFIANLKADCKANYVKLTVTPDGKKYTVSIPATGKENVFDTKSKQ